MAISYDRFHIIAIATEAMDDVQREELRTERYEVTRTLLGANSRTGRKLLWGMRRNWAGWTAPRNNAMQWLQRSALKSTRAWLSHGACAELMVRRGRLSDLMEVLKRTQHACEYILASHRELSEGDSVWTHRREG